jgi:broad specificity phosphatase PhoE
VLLALVRHGEQAGSGEDGRPVLERDSPRGLTLRGRAQAEGARDFLADLDADEVLCSDAARAVETARIVAAGRPVRPSPGLAGLALGEWEGRPRDALPELAGILATVDRRPPGGESLADLLARARAALCELLPATGDAIVVAHRMTNAVLLADALGLPLADAGVVQQDPGAVSLVERDEGELRVLMANVSPLDPLRRGVQEAAIV